MPSPYRRISIHALREEGDASAATGEESVEISIHALREEGDHIREEAYNTGYSISIHALREEGDELSSALLVTSALFLSTPSARRATGFCLIAHRPIRISIHALREEGDGPQGQGHIVHRISIHALREEGDFHTARNAVQ